MKTWIFFGGHRNAAQVFVCEYEHYNPAALVEVVNVIDAETLEDAAVEYGRFVRRKVTLQPTETADLWQLMFSVLEYEEVT